MMYYKPMKSDNWHCTLKKDRVSYPEAQDNAKFLNDQFSSEYTTEDMLVFHISDQALQQQFLSCGSVRNESETHKRAKTRIRLRDQIRSHLDFWRNGFFNRSGLDSYNPGFARPGTKQTSGKALLSLRFQERE